MKALIPALGFVLCGLNSGTGLMPIAFNTQINSCSHQTHFNIEVHYIHSAKFTEEQLKDFSEESKKEVREKRRTFVLRSNGKNSTYMFEGEAQSEQVIDERTEERTTIKKTKRDEFSYSNYFKDFEDRKIVNQRFLGGETYLIDEKLRDFDWEIGGETFEIGGYSCRQATATVGNGNMLIAWFTDEIAIPDGPLIYHGLPGLILKIEAGNTEITAATVRMRDNVEITKPTVGKKVSKEEMGQILNAFRNQQDYDRTEGNRRTIRKTISVTK